MAMPCRQPQVYAPPGTGILLGGPGPWGWQDRETDLFQRFTTLLGVLEGRFAAAVHYIIKILCRCQWAGVPLRPPRRAQLSHLRVSLVGVLGAGPPLSARCLGASSRQLRPSANSGLARAWS